MLHIHKILARESKVGRENNLRAGRKGMDTCEPLRNSNFPVVFAVPSCRVVCLDSVAFLVEMVCALLLELV